VTEPSVGFAEGFLLFSLPCILFCLSSQEGKGKGMQKMDISQTSEGRDRKLIW
jgi:hypothetical protein